jgi:hypothetical protein
VTSLVARATQPPTKLNFRSMRARRGARRHHPELDRQLPPARHRPVHLPRRCAAEDQRTSRQPGPRTHPAPLETALRRQPEALRHQRIRGLAADPDPKYAIRRAFLRQARWLRPPEEFAPGSFGLAGQAPDFRFGRRFAARGASGATVRSLLDRRSGQQRRGPVHLCIRSVLERRPTIQRRNPPLVQGVSGPPDPRLIASASRRRGLNAYAAAALGSCGLASSRPPHARR